jgi:hypothetical protein
MPADEALKSHTAQFLDEVTQITKLIDRSRLEAMACELASLRERHGRLFLIGVGGSVTIYSVMNLLSGMTGSFPSSFSHKA